MNLSSKFLQDVNGTNFAPITTPNAVRWPNGDDLDDKLPTTMGASGSGHKGGLVPDTPSTAGTTKFLREDGTWQVPAVESAGGTLDVIPIVREIDLTDYPINDIDSWAYSDSGYDTFGVNYSVHLDYNSGNFYMLTYNDGNGSYSWTQVTVDWDNYYVELANQNYPLTAYNHVENGVRSNTVIYASDFSSRSDYYMHASHGVTEIVRGDVNAANGLHVGYSYYPKTTCHVPLSTITENLTYGTSAYSNGDTNSPLYSVEINGFFGNLHVCYIVNDISEVYINSGGSGKTINVIFINNTNIEHSISISQSSSSLTTPDGNDITLTVPPSGEGYSELSIYCHDGLMFARAA